MQGHKAIILGASGLIGSELLKLLLQSDTFNHVTAVGRRALPVTHLKLSQFTTNLEAENPFAELKLNADIIFCCIGTTQKQVKDNKERYEIIDYGIPIKAARWGKENGVRKFILVTAIGANKNASNFYLNLKGRVETDLAQIGIEQTDVFRPSLLLGHRKEARLGEDIASWIMPALGVLMVGKMAKYKPIRASIVAKAMYHCSLHEVKGHHVHEYNSIKLLSHT